MRPHTCPTLSGFFKAAKSVLNTTSSCHTRKTQKSHQGKNIPTLTWRFRFLKYFPRLKKLLRSLSKSQPEGVFGLLKNGGNWKRVKLQLSFEFHDIEGKDIPTVCAAKGRRPRYPRVWKTKRRIGTIAKSARLVECIKELSNVKEEVYGALDFFVGWELEFPIITVKKALKTLEYQQEWKRIIQVTKWMLSKGQGGTMGSYFTLLNALAEDDRLDEAEELWTKLLMQNLKSLPHKFFDKMIFIYQQRSMHKKMLEIFADMEELGVRPSISAVSMIGNVLKYLGMLDQYEKLHRKYPPPKWEYRYIKGKRVKIKVKRQDESNQVKEEIEKHEGAEPDSNEQGGWI